MWERYDRNTIKVLDERESIAEFAVVDQVTDSTYCRCKSVLLYFAIEELVQVIDIEAAACVLMVLHARHDAVTVCTRVALSYTVTDGVQVSLVDVSAASNVQSMELLL